VISGWVFVVQVAAIILFFFGIWLFIITLRAAKWSPENFKHHMRWGNTVFGRRFRHARVTPEFQQRWVWGLRAFSIVWVLGCLYALLMAYKFFLT
jgi:uncharacterized BrkB/YihY/UPF0761 family membrane protein